MNVQIGMSEWGRRIIGLLIGFLLWSIWGFLVYSISSINLIQNIQIDIHDSLGTWIYLGPIPLIVGAGFYFVNRSYWPDMKQKEQSAVLLGGVTGFIIWSLMMISIPDIRVINGLFPNLAGWLFMILFILFFKWRVHPGNRSDA
jgi:hypothetical protein